MFLDLPAVNHGVYWACLLSCFEQRTEQAGYFTMVDWLARTQGAVGIDGAVVVREDRAVGLGVAALVGVPEKLDAGASVRVRSSWCSATSLIS